MLVDGIPAAQVEVADAEVGAVGALQGLGQGVAEVAVDVVEDAGHRGHCSSVGGRRLCGWRLFADGLLGLCRQVSHKSADFASEMGAEVPPARGDRPDLFYSCSSGKVLLPSQSTSHHLLALRNSQPSHVSMTCRLVKEYS